MYRPAWMTTFRNVGTAPVSVRGPPVREARHLRHWFDFARCADRVRGHSRNRIRLLMVGGL